MKKAVWIAFGAAIVGVNAAAEAVEYFTDTELVAYFRVMLIMGVLFITMVFFGSLRPRFSRRRRKTPRRLCSQYAWRR